MCYNIYRLFPSFPLGVFNQTIISKMTGPEVCAKRENNNLSATQTNPIAPCIPFLNAYIISRVRSKPSHLLQACTPANI